MTFQVASKQSPQAFKALETRVSILTKIPRRVNPAADALAREPDGCRPLIRFGC